MTVWHVSTLVIAMPSIPIRVLQFDDEPAWSVLRRLARRSGTISSGDFCRDFDLDWRSIENGTDLGPFAERGGYNRSDLDKNSISVRRTHYEFRGEWINKLAVFSGGNRVCPSCLDDDRNRASVQAEFAPHWRDWWFLKSITACPIHRVELVVTHTVQTRTRIPTKILDPWDGVPYPPTLVGAKDVSAETYFLGRLQFLPATPHWLLDSLSLANAMKVVTRFGAASSNGEADAKESSSDKSLQAQHNSKGFAVLRTRASLDQFFDTIVSAFTPASTREGPGAAYGTIYDWLRTEAKAINSGTAFEQIRRILREHAHRHLDRPPKEDLFNQRLRRSLNADRTDRRDRDQALSKGEGLTADTEWYEGPLQVAVETSGLSADTPRDRAAPAPHLEMGREVLLRRYGIPRGTFLVLRKAGRLLPKPCGTRGKGDRLVWHEHDVDAWFSLLAHGAPDIDQVPNGMTSLVGASLVSQTAIDVIVSSLLSGRLKARGKLTAESRWPSIILSVEEIRSLRASDAVEGFLNKRQIVIRLQSTHRIVDALIDQGHLAHTILIGSTGIPWVAVSVEAVDAFAGSFMPPRSAAWHVGTAVKSLRKRLGFLNIDPVIDLRISKNSVFYRRSDVETITAGSLQIYT